MASEPIITAEVVPPTYTLDRPRRQQPPLAWRELLAVVLMVVLADLTLYRACGFAGYATFFFVAPLLFCLGTPRPPARNTRLDGLPNRRPIHAV